MWYRAIGALLFSGLAVPVFADPIVEIKKLDPKVKVITTKSYRAYYSSVYPDKDDIGPESLVETFVESYENGDKVSDESFNIWNTSTKYTYETKRDLDGRILEHTEFDVYGLPMEKKEYHYQYDPWSKTSGMTITQSFYSFNSDNGQLRVSAENSEYYFFDEQKRWTEWIGVFGGGDRSSFQNHYDDRGRLAETTEKLNGLLVSRSAFKYLDNGGWKVDRSACRRSISVTGDPDKEELVSTKVFNGDGICEQEIKYNIYDSSVPPSVNERDVISYKYSDSKIGRIRTEKLVETFLKNPPPGDDLYKSSTARETYEYEFYGDEPDKSDEDQGK